MEAKEKLQLRLLRMMSNSLSDEQLKILKDSMSAVMYDYGVTEIDDTELAQYEGSKTEQLIKYYTVSKLASNTGRETIVQYVRVVRQLCDICHKELDEITKEDVRYFLIEYARKNNIKASTMDSKRRYLSSVYSYLYANEMIPKNPMSAVEPIKTKKVIKKPLTDEEIERLKLACKSKRDLAILILFLETGVRVSELSRINISDIDFIRREIKILGKGNKERIVFFTGKSYVMLTEYLKDREDINNGNVLTLWGTDKPLFVSNKAPHERLQKAGIQRTITDLRETSGVHRVHCHLLRATYATALARRGVGIDVIAKLLGHANLHTIDRYVLIEHDELQEAIRKVGSAA